MQPQQDEMWIEVCEKLLGLNGNKSDCPCCGTPRTCALHVYLCPDERCECNCDMVPPLTLDALYEAEKKLTEEQQAAYLIELKKEAYGGPTQIQALYHICASKEQRLLALWRTITQRSPVDATP